MWKRNRNVVVHICHLIFVKDSLLYLFSDAIGLEDLKNKDVMPVKTLEEHPTSAYR